MKSKTKRQILPSDRLVLNILNRTPGAEDEVLAFYDRYIRTMATGPVYTADGSRTGTSYDEDLAQELRIALVRSLPAVRKVLIKNHFTNHPDRVTFKDHTK